MSCFEGFIFLSKEHPHTLCRVTSSILLDLLILYRCRCVVGAYLLAVAIWGVSYLTIFFTTLYSPRTTVTGGVLFYAHTVHNYCLRFHVHCVQYRGREVYTFMQFFMQTATINKGNKVARIKQVAIDLYKVVVAQASDLTEFGDVLVAREFKTAQGALRFANKQLT